MNCPACLREIKGFNGKILLERYDIVPILIANESFEEAKAFAERVNFDFPVFSDNALGISGELEISYVPTVFLVQDGFILRSWEGASFDEKSLIQKIGAPFVKD